MTIISPPIYVLPHIFSYYVLKYLSANDSDIFWKNAFHRIRLCYKSWSLKRIKRKWKRGAQLIWLTKFFISRLATRLTLRFPVLFAFPFSWAYLIFETESFMPTMWSLSWNLSHIPKGSPTDCEQKGARATSYHPRKCKQSAAMSRNV